MKRNNLPIYYSIAMLFGLAIGTFFSNNGSINLPIGKSSVNERKIKRLLHYIERDYVDKVNANELLDNTITEMLTKLDPHSVYIPKEELQRITENMQGNFVGIGVQFRIINDTITVIRPIDGGPSIKAGIKSGDRILMAGKDTLFNKKIKTEDIFKALKGERKTKIKLQIYRKLNDSIFNATVIRDNVNIKSVETSYMLNDSIGYIKLDRFAQNTYKEFKTSLDDLTKKGMTDLVLDIRGNSGGFIHIAKEIVDEFLEDEKLIVYTKNNKDRVTEYFATEKGDFEKGGLYVLIDENSASASEIVAGALQDNDKGVIIGRRSFGKGLVQEEKDLGDGSAVRLTVARYYTPTGRSIQKPYDASKENNNEHYKTEVGTRYHNGELYNKDSIQIIDTLAFKTPKGKTVYGGGGIIPDVFIAMDSSKFISPIYYKPLNEFAFNYVDKHRKELLKLSVDQYKENFDKEFKVSGDFFEYLESNNPYKEQKLKISKNTKKQLVYYLKSLIARELFDDEGWYKMKQEDDKMIQKVFELEQNN